MYFDSAFQLKRRWKSGANWFSFSRPVPFQPEQYIRATSMPKDHRYLPMARQMITGGLVLLALSFVHHDWSRISVEKITLDSWMGFSYLVVFGSLFGFTAYVWLMRVSSPARVSTISYVNLVIAVLLGWTVGGGTPDVALPRGSCHHCRIRCACVDEQNEVRRYGYLKASYCHGPPGGPLPREVRVLTGRLNWRLDKGCDLLGHLFKRRFNVLQAKTLKETGPKALAGRIAGKFRTQGINLAGKRGGDGLAENVSVEGVTKGQKMDVVKSFIRSCEKSSPEFRTNFSA
jgi:hypothetical protein